MYRVACIAGKPAPTFELTPTENPVGSKAAALLILI
jgi:hypothetical protein